MCDSSKPGAVVRESVARWFKELDAAKQRRPLAPREELSVGQAEAWTKFGGRERQRRPWAPLAEQEGYFAGACITRIVERREGAAGGARSGTCQVPA